jgi:hypothetical protein
MVGGDRLRLTVYNIRKALSFKRYALSLISTSKINFYVVDLRLAFSFFASLTAIFAKIGVTNVNQTSLQRYGQLSF